MKKKVAIVAGALGIAGQALVAHLRTRHDWDVVGLSRRTPEGSDVRHIAVDLLDPTSCSAKVGPLVDATHIFYCAFTPRGSAREELVPNVAMLRNLVSTLERVAPALTHVQLLQGTRWYGHHLGAYRTPAKEDDPRHMPPNFYYEQQDWLADLQHGKQWTWSALRPHCICGIAVGSPMNHLFALALYAVVSRELDLPLRFPGTATAFRSIYQFTDARLLARAMVWAATTAACENRAFNLTNGEFERWENIWPALAHCFGMEPGPVQTLKLAQAMSDKEDLWTRVRQKHGLREHRLSDLVDWRFADWAYSNGFDQMSSLTKARQAGWYEVLDTMAMFRELIGELVRCKFIPSVERG